MRFQDIPLPDLMKHNKRDRRGYPVPYIVMRDKHNKPLFKVNDARFVKRCLLHNRCAICGNKMGEVIYFVGGPGAALHPQGAYVDPPMHHECATYALQVCPFLAVRRYVGEKPMYVYEPPEGRVIVEDEEMMKGKPPIFILKSTHGFVNFGHYDSPRLVVNDTIDMEFWKDGQKLDENDPWVWDTIRESLELIADSEDRSEQQDMRSPAMTSLVAYGR